MDGVQPLGRDGVQRALRASGALTPADVIALQRTVGNAAVQRLLADHTASRQPAAPLPVLLGNGQVIQPKLTVGPVNDGYVRQADQVASDAVRNIDAPAGHGADAAATDRSLQRKELVQRESAGTVTKPVFRKSNTVHWYDWTDKGFAQSTRTVAKGVKLAQARPTIFPDYAWVVTETGSSGYLRKQSLTVKTWSDEKNPKNPKYEDKEYLDENRLLTPVGVKGEKDKEYESTHREWYLDQAVLMKAYRASTDEGTKKQLALAMLQSFAKAATYTQKDIETLGVQTTPLIRKYFYHRSAGSNVILDDLRKLIATEMKVPEGVLQTISDPLFMDVLAREFPVYRAGKEPKKPVKTQIDTAEQFGTSIDALLENFGAGHAPEGTFVFDVTKLYTSLDCKPDEMQAKIARPLEKILIAKSSKLLTTSTELSRDALIKSILQHIQVVILTKVKGVDVLLVPELFSKLSDKEQEGYSKEENQMFGAIDAKTRKVFMEAGSHDDRKLDSAMIESGARMDPIAAKKAMLEFATAETLLSDFGATLSELATSGAKTPTICKDIHAFLKTNAFVKFRQLSAEKDAPPYQKLYPAATADLLAGLAKVSGEKGGLDQVFADKQLTDVLQHAYYRMLNAMAGATTYRSDLIQFLNNIELIHDQLQMILAIAEPHAPETSFSKSIKEALKMPPAYPEKATTEPIVPGEFDPLVHHKASAMHSVASILTGVEAEKEKRKGTRSLNALVLKDNYYEAHGAVLHSSKTYQVEELNGWELRSEEGKDLEMKDKAFKSGKMPPEKSIDIFICDFHHNISVERSEYRPENVTYQVDQLFRKNLVADSFTVAIDCTVDFVRSEDIQKFLEHHKARITEGKMNVVLYRSAQKFDMLGMDNYYGGFTITINDGKSYDLFNKRMAIKEDQVSGLSHQGLAHLAQFGGEYLDAYRKALMENTKKLYELLMAKGMGDQTGSIYIGKTTDPNNVFLDIQIPGSSSELAGKTLSTMLVKWAQAHKLALTTRPSFGFPTSNLTSIAGSKIRLNPGLESEEAINLYVTFFTSIKDMLTKRLDENVFNVKPRDQWDAKTLSNKIEAHLSLMFQLDKAHEKILPIAEETPTTPTKTPTFSGPQGVPSSGVKNTKGLEKLLTKPKGKQLTTETTATILPAPAPLTFGGSIDPNPFLYFQVNSVGEYNFRVDKNDPGGSWVRIEQFCAYLATHWLTHGHSAGGLKFSELNLVERQDAVQTLIDWSASGLAAQEVYARAKLGGATVTKPTVHQKAKGEASVYADGTRIWFGTDRHAQAAVLTGGNYAIYDPNTGIVTEKTGAQFALYSADDTCFVVG